MRNASKDCLLKSVLQEKIGGKKESGRKRISWLKNFRTWFSKTTTIDSHKDARVFFINNLEKKQLKT